LDGKYNAPQRVESLLKQRQGISNAMTFGDRRPYLVALITVDREALRSTRPELADLAIDDPRLATALEPEIDEVNRHLARYESVRRFRLVEPDFSAEGGELTVTLKLKRRVVAERQREAIEGLYREGVRGKE
jgi:long-chain acyl-CoA synthetase